MNFTAIDFETAHAYFPCEIGLTRVENGKIAETKSWLIKPACFPYVNPYHERIHGISAEQLVSAQTFDELWGELKLWLDEQIVAAHNAPFDMGVLRASLAHYDLAIPYMDYFCSVQVARKVWKQLPSHSLGNLCQFHDIRFEHHRAGDDAKACALIVLKAFENIENCDISDGLNGLNVKLKRLKY